MKKIIKTMAITAGVLTSAMFFGNSQKTFASNYIASDNNVWYCYDNNHNIDYGFNGILPNENGWWKVSNGVVDFDYTGMIENENGWWFVIDGAVDFSYDGVGINDLGAWKFDNGTITFNANGEIDYDGKTYKVVDSYIDGLAEAVSELNPMDYDNEEFIEQVAVSVSKYAPEFGIKVHSPIIAQACLESAYGKSEKAKYFNLFGLKYRENRISANNGVFTDASQEQNSDGSYEDIVTKWYSFDSIDSCVLGYFQFINNSNYSNLKGITDPYEYLSTIRADGYATSQKYVDNVYATINNNDLTRYDDPVINSTGISQNENGWWYFVNGNIDYSYNGMAENEYGWWKITNGAVDFNYTGMAENENGWWYFNNGQIDWDYTGMAENENGWWYFNNGQIDWDYTGMAENENGWWYFNNGQIDWDYTGMAENENGWWYFNNGQIDWDYTGMAENENGWWYFNNGQIDWDYTGMAQNEHGTWKYNNGTVTFSDNEVTVYGGKKYKVINSYAQEITDEK